MVTRRAVLKGTAAASIGAIAAAHGAQSAEAGTIGFDVGYAQLTGGAIGGFVKQPDACQSAVKFDKFAAEVFFKEDVTGGVAVFYKFFSKVWSGVLSEPVDSTHFPDLKTSALYFSKLDGGGAELFVKNEMNL